MTAEGKTTLPGNSLPPNPRSQDSQTPAPKPDTAKAALFVGIFGASGSGKSHDIKAMIDRRGLKLTLIFDPGHEYGGCNFTTDETAFLKAASTATLGLLVFRPSFDAALRERQFSRFCSAVLAIARARGDVLAVIDELHLVTQAGHAPASWQELVQTGRKFGAAVIAASIRPAAIDKSFWTNCTHVRAHRVNFTEDQKTLANCLGVPIEEVQALTGHQSISRNLLTGQITRE